MSEPRYFGLVRHWDEPRGFGFIEPDDKGIIPPDNEGRHLFCHASALQNVRSLAAQTRVSFELGEHKGRTVAIKVNRIETGNE